LPINVILFFFSLFNIAAGHLMLTGISEVRVKSAEIKFPHSIIDLLCDSSVTTRR
jgi:hypothetical protein